LVWEAVVWPEPELAEEEVERNSMAMQSVAESFEEGSVDMVVAAAHAMVGVGLETVQVAVG